MTKTKAIAFLLAMLAVSSWPGTALAQSWPVPGKPITFVNPFPPGGAVDDF